LPHGALEGREEPQLRSAMDPEAPATLARAHDLVLAPLAADAEDPAGGAADACRAALGDEGAFVEDLRSLSCALLRCPGPLAAPVARALALGSELLEVGKGSDDAFEAPSGCPVSCIYKQQGKLKERLQARRVAASADPSAAAAAAFKGAGDASSLSASSSSSSSSAAAAAVAGDGQAALAEAMASLEVVALACFEAWCRREEVPASAALERFGDVETGAAAPRAGTKSKSVLNLYNYFNEEACEEAPCREHADPGLLTVLCRSSNAALQVRFPLRPGGSPGKAAEYEDVWRDIEPEMDRHCSQDSSGDIVLLVVVGETLERLSAGTFPSCRHRVARCQGLRFNMAYELRPRMNVFHPWATLVSGAGG